MRSRPLLYEVAGKPRPQKPCEGGAILAHPKDTAVCSLVKSNTSAISAKRMNVLPCSEASRPYVLKLQEILDWS